MSYKFRSTNRLLLHSWTLGRQAGCKPVACASALDCDHPWVCSTGHARGRLMAGFDLRLSRCVRELIVSYLPVGGGPRRVPKRRPSNNNISAKSHTPKSQVCLEASRLFNGEAFHGLCLLVFCVLCFVGLFCPSRLVPIAVWVYWVAIFVILQG